MPEKDPNGVGRYPNNSHRARDGGEDNPPEPRVKRVATGRRRKKPLGRKFLEAFGAGGDRDDDRSVIRDMLIPDGKVLMVDAFFSYVEYMVFGETRGRGRRSRGSDRSGGTRYADRFRDGREPRRANTHTRSSYDIGEIVVDSRVEAEEVLDTLFNLIGEYQFATVRDLFQMTDIETNPMDRRWGWDDLRGSRIHRLPNGSYLIDLPRPIELD